MNQMTYQILKEAVKTLKRRENYLKLKRVTLCHDRYGRSNEQRRNRCLGRQEAHLTTVVREGESQEQKINKWGDILSRVGSENKEGKSEKEKG